ncbi:MAG: hypothetical protein MUE72_13760 [Chitinophagaceae bacterium]|jgi:hypothetical protein|nr:hypothetical protein [Chitinophagaceae bacterium]
MNTKYKINRGLLLQWLIFLPMILTIAVLTGAMEGLKKVIKQAEKDILDLTTDGNTFQH